MPPRPPALLLAAAAQGAEAVVLLAAAVLSAVDTASGRSYQRSSGIALTVIAFGAVAVVAFIAWGIYRARRWSRTPALLTQLFVGTTGVYLLEGHRLDWGVPTLLLAIAGFVGLLLPPSLRALATGPRSAEPRQAAAPAAAQDGPPATVTQGAGLPTSRAPARAPGPGPPARRARKAPPAAADRLLAGRRASAAAACSPLTPPRRARGSVLGGEALAELGQGTGQQPGDVHLARCRARWRSATGSCCRRTAAAGSASPAGQPLEQRLERLPVLHALERLVDDAERVGDRGRVLVPGVRRVQRDRGVGVGRLQALQHVLLAHPQVRGELADRGRAALALGELARSPWSARA